MKMSGNRMDAALAKSAKGTRVCKERKSEKSQENLMLLFCLHNLILYEDFSSQCPHFVVNLELNAARSTFYDSLPLIRLVGPVTTA